MMRHGEALLRLCDCSGVFEEGGVIMLQARVLPRFHAKYAPLLTAFLMSMLMAFLMSGLVTFLNTGMNPHFVSIWLHAFIKVWPVAFALLFILRPMVMRMVAYLTQEMP